MGKQRRKAEREERQRLKLLEGGGEPNAAPASHPFPRGAVPLEDRPEYQAQMTAWKASGAVPGPS